MEFFLYAILFSAVYFYAGIGLTFLLIPKQFEKYSLYISPFTGLAYLSYCSWFLFEYSTWGTNQYAALLLIPPLFFLILAFFMKNERATEILFPLKRENLPIIVICIIIFLMISSPYFFKIDGISNTITLGNNDIIEYAAASKYLMSSSELYSPIVYVPTSIDTILFFLQNTYFSSMLATAIPCSLFHLEPYQAINLVIYLFFIFILPILYIIAVEIFDHSKNIALLITLLIGINWHLFYIVYDGFLGQCIGTGFFLVLILLTFYPILKCENFSDIIKFLPINVLICFGLLISYNVFVPLFLIPSFLFILLYYIYSKSKRFVFQSSTYIFLTFLIVAIISPLSFNNRFFSLFYFNDAVAGWDLPLMTPEKLFGLIYKNMFEPIPIFFTILLSTIIIVFFIVSLYRLFEKDKKRFFLFSSFLLFVIVFYCILFIKEALSPSFSGDGYKAYKLLTYFIPLTLLIGLYFLEFLNSPNTKMNSWQKNITRFLLCLLIVGCLASTFGLMWWNATGSTSIDKDIIDLRKINSYNNISSINIEDNAYWGPMWIHYFLFENTTIYFKYPSYYSASPLNGDWTLKEVKPDILSPTSLNGSIRINNKYFLENNNSYITTNKSCTTTLFKGWYDLESLQGLKWRWGGMMNETPTVKLFCSDEIQSIDIYLVYWALNPNNNISITLDNETIVNCPERQCDIDNVGITNGTHIISFDSSLPPEQPGTQDQRYLGYAFSNITIIPH